MADDTTDDDVKLVIPEETLKKYPELVEKIKKSKSMTNSERNYWLQVLPVMTPDQVSELQDILDTEVKKLAEIDEKYRKRGQSSGDNSSDKKPVKELSQEDIKKLDEEKRKKRENLRKAEEKSQEGNTAEDILSQLD